MYGHLMSLGIISIVEGTEDVISAPLPEANAADKAEYKAYSLQSNKATGELYQWLDEANKIHVDAVRCNPKSIWDKLKEVHSKSALNSCFNSLSELFNIWLHEDESLLSLSAHVEGAMQKVTVLCPAMGYDIKKLDEELTIMAMICALPHEEYSSFISSVLLLTTLSKDSVLDAFCTEETQRKGNQDELDAATAAAVAHILSCYICDGDHTMLNCPLYENV